MTAVDTTAALIAALASIQGHLDTARAEAHDLINSIRPEALSVTAIAAEQSVEMDLRHALRDLTTLGFYLPKDGGAVA